MCCAPSQCLKFALRLMHSTTEVDDAQGAHQEPLSQPSYLLRRITEQYFYTRLVSIVAINIKDWFPGARPRRFISQHVHNVSVPWHHQVYHIASLFIHLSLELGLKRNTIRTK
jgi:hypothetical protein